MLFFKIPDWLFLGTLSLIVLLLLKQMFYMDFMVYPPTCQPAELPNPSLCSLITFFLLKQPFYLSPYQVLELPRTCLAENKFHIYWLKQALSILNLFIYKNNSNYSKQQLLNLNMHLSNHTKFKSVKSLDEFKIVILQILKHTDKHYTKSNKFFTFKRKIHPTYSSEYDACLFDIGKACELFSKDALNDVKIFKLTKCILDK